MVLGSNPDTAWGGANTTYSGTIYTYYKGTIIDKADLNAAKFSAFIFGDNNTCNVFARLYDATNGASIVGSEVYHSSISACTVQESGDIKANLPTTDVVLVVQTRSSNAATDWRCRWAGLWLDF